MFFYIRKTVLNKRVREIKVHKREVSIFSRPTLIKYNPRFRYEHQTFFLPSCIYIGTII